MIKLRVSLCAFLSVLVFEGCSFSDVKDAITLTDKSDKAKDSADAQLAKDDKEEFVVELDKLKKVARHVHMLWVIDNSGTMAEEVKAVREGITSFVEGLKESSNEVELTMITSTSKELKQPLNLWEKAKKLVGRGSQSQYIPDYVLRAAGAHPVVYHVESQHQLHLFAQYLSPSHFEDYGFEFEGDRRLPSSLDQHPSQDFFRSAEALKVFVVVTDEGEKSAGGKSASDSFLSLLSDLYKSLSSFRFFGFLNLSVDNTPYDHLVAELGGDKWDIQQLTPKQWQELLKKAQDHMIQEVLQRVFSLKHPAENIYEVKVNGALLSKKDWYGAHQELHVKASQIKEGDEVEVFYRKKEG